MDVFTAFSKVRCDTRSHRRDIQKNSSLTPIFWLVEFR